MRHLDKDRGAAQRAAPLFRSEGYWLGGPQKPSSSLEEPIREP